MYVLPDGKEFPPNELDLERRVRIQHVTATVWVNLEFVKFGGKEVFLDHCDRNSSGYLDKHIVTIYGFGVTRSGLQYWPVLNSWGTAWGNKGCIRMAKNIGYPQGISGIASDCLYPLDCYIEL